MRGDLLLEVRSVVLIGVSYSLGLRYSGLIASSEHTAEAHAIRHSYGQFLAGTKPRC
jgi:hypothetical protein